MFIIPLYPFRTTTKQNSKAATTLMRSKRAESPRHKPQIRSKNSILETRPSNSQLSTRWSSHENNCHSLPSHPGQFPRARPCFPVGSKLWGEHIELPFWIMAMLITKQCYISWLASLWYNRKSSAGKGAIEPFESRLIRALLVLYSTVPRHFNSFCNFPEILRTTSLNDPPVFFSNWRSDCRAATKNWLH